MNARLQEIRAAGAEPPGLEARVEKRLPLELQPTNQVRLEGRWRRVFENLAIGIALADSGGQILVANAALQGMLGYSEEEFQSLTFYEVTHEKDRGALQSRVREVKAQQSSLFSRSQCYSRGAEP